MKKIYLLTLTLLSICMASMAQQKWDFLTLSANDEANLTADWSFSDPYYYNTSTSGKGIYVGRYSKKGKDYSPYFNVADSAAKYSSTVEANGVELEMTKGLKFGFANEGSRRFQGNNNKAFRIYKGKKGYGIYPQMAGAFFVIPNVAVGDTVIVVSRPGGKEGRGLTSENLTILSGFESTIEPNNVLNKGVSKVNGNVLIGSIGKTSILLSVEVKKPTTDISQLRTSVIGRPENIYNLNGQFVGTDLNKLPQGVYIQYGKKVIKK